MKYGILASNSCLLTDIVDQSHEPSRNKTLLFQMENWRIFPLQKAGVPIWKLPGTETKSNQCIKFLSDFVYGISESHFYEIRNKCTKSCCYMDRRSGQRKNIILLLPAGKRYLPKFGSGGAYLSASIYKTAILLISKKRQIDTLRDHIHFWITVYGNSSGDGIAQARLSAFVIYISIVWTGSCPLKGRGPLKGCQCH